MPIYTPRLAREPRGSETPTVPNMTGRPGCPRQWKCQQIGIVQKVCSEKVSAITRMRQKCVRMGLVLLLAKGFCRTKFWAKFPFWRGAVRGEVFREVCREVFHEVFGLVLLGHSEQKNFSRTSALNSHDPPQQNWRNFREKLHDEVLQGDPRQFYWEKRNVPKCVKIASKIRGIPLGENTFWTIPRKKFRVVPRSHPLRPLALYFA